MDSDQLYVCSLNMQWIEITCGRDSSALRILHLCEYVRKNTDNEYFACKCGLARECSGRVAAPLLSDLSSCQPVLIPAFNATTFTYYVTYLVMFDLVGGLFCDLSDWRHHKSDLLCSTVAKQNHSRQTVKHSMVISFEFPCLRSEASLELDLHINWVTGRTPRSTDPHLSR